MSHIRCGRTSHSSEVGPNRGPILRAHEGPDRFGGRGLGRPVRRGRGKRRCGRRASVSSRVSGGSRVPGSAWDVLAVQTTALRVEEVGGRSRHHQPGGDQESVADSDTYAQGGEPEGHRQPGVAAAVLAGAARGAVGHRRRETGVVAMQLLLKGAQPFVIRRHGVSLPVRRPLGPSGAGPVVRHGQGPPGPEFMIGGGVRKDYRGQHPYPGVRTMQTGGGPYAPPGAGAGASGRRRVSRAQRR
ncbi:protein of unknown function [Streptomyces sp. KY75]|nr:protein of unknown function [Streptomyces sp. KY70]CAD5991259.1 protein of unknown function [Streptomyces sp. KY75]